MSEEKERIVLTGDEALEKFLAGKDVWNAYVDGYPEADVDFSGVDFSVPGRTNRKFNFSHYRFPKKGFIKFKGARFNGATVDFSYTSFGDSFVDFSQALFCGGSVDFSNAKFGTDVDFSHSEFSDYGVSFSHAQFGNGYTKFIGVKFGNGFTCFFNIKFTGIEMNFSDSKVGAGGASYSKSKFGTGKITFNLSEFQGHVTINDLIDPGKLESLSLRHCTFDKTLDISNNNFKCIPDLTNTKLTNQLSLDRMTCEFQFEENSLPDIADGERLCRLKELAKANKNHQQALTFHAQEMRVKRYFSTGCAKQLDGLFDYVSRYGLSISRPTIGLGLLTGGFAFIYSLISLLIVCPTQITEIIKTFGNGVLYAAAQVLPFVSSGRLATLESANRLFDSDMPNWIYIFSLAQGSLSFVLLFLIGLGVRNRFRL